MTGDRPHDDGFGDDFGDDWDPKKDRDSDRDRGSGVPEPGECFSRDSQGRCTQRFNEEGKLELDPDYAERACEAYHDMMRSVKEVSAGAGGTNLPGAANAATGGRSKLLKAVSKFLSQPGFIFLRGVAYLTGTAMVSGATPPPGCR